MDKDRVAEVNAALSEVLAPEGSRFSVKREAWDPGPWDDEPDRWEAKMWGFPVLALRNRYGAWCGYVGVPSGHPWYGQDYDTIDADVHGGLTFAGPCDDDPAVPADERICHVPEPGEPDDVWWLGFDCHHWLDIAPGMEIVTRITVGDPPEYQGVLNPAYKNLDYVAAEIETLAAQAFEAVDG